MELFENENRYRCSFAKIHKISLEAAKGVIQRRRAALLTKGHEIAIEFVWVEGSFAEGHKVSIEAAFLIPAIHIYRNDG